MLKKITLAVMGFSMAALPMLSAVHASAGGWESIQAEAAWDYGSYRVERLAFSDNAVGPFSLGDSVFVAEPTDICTLTHCDRYELSKLENGARLSFENVPDEALDAFRYELNDGRLAYVNPLEDDNHFSVVERDLETGDTTVLIEDVFLTGVEDIDALVDGDDVYLEAKLNFNNSSVNQSAIYVWNPAKSVAEILGTHWELRQENLLDAEDGVALEMLEFDEGYKQLWFGDTHNVDYFGMTRTAISGTWTEPHGDIIAAHFLNDGTLEYFQYFVRYTYNPGVDAAPVRHDGQELSWYRDLDSTYQMVGDRLAWIDAQDNVYVSDDGDVVKLGTAARGSFLLEDDRVYWATPDAGKVYDFDTKSTTETDIGVTDTADGAVVGLDESGTVWYQNTDTGATLSLGFGTNAVISDNAHVYWLGTDGLIYEATILPSAGTMQAMKLSTSPIVYLIQGDERMTIPSEAVYFSYFDSWTSVQTVSSTTLNGYTLNGTAKFAPGTKVKFTDGPRVYVVGDDGQLHWIVSQTVAYSLYGTTWAQDILTVTTGQMAGYPIGDVIESESDISLI
jgi:hypothetical protein